MKEIPMGTVKKGNDITEFHECLAMQEEFAMFRLGWSVTYMRMSSLVFGLASREGHDQSKEATDHP